MKTERRHELQTNVLADWLGHTVDHVRPYTKTIIAVALLVVGGLLAYVVVANTQSAQSANAWNAYYAAIGQRDTKQLEAVAEEHPGSTAGLWASQSAADIELVNGTSELYRDRNAAVKPLEEAVRLYKVVLQQNKGATMLQHRARFGLGKAYECLSVADGGKAKNDEYLEEAKQNYEAVVRESPNSAIGHAAAARLETLAGLVGGEGEDNFYWWFASQKPITPTPQTPAPSIADLPERPSLDPLFGQGLIGSGALLPPDRSPIPDGAADGDDSQAAPDTSDASSTPGTEDAAAPAAGKDSPDSKPASTAKDAPADTPDAPADSATDAKQEAGDVDQPPKPKAPAEKEESDAPPAGGSHPEDSSATQAGATDPPAPPAPSSGDPSSSP